jgi:predicted  nucleic acid-binding Zn-ribbon protein
MDNLINPEIRDLQQRVSRLEGQYEEIKRVASDTSRQTLWQFVAFAAVMAGVLIGSSIFQTEALRRETVAKFDAVNQRFEQVEKGLDKIEKAIEGLTQEIRASRSRE